MILLDWNNWPSTDINGIATHLHLFPRLSDCPPIGKSLSSCGSSSSSSIVLPTKASLETRMNIIISWGKVGGEKWPVLEIEKIAKCHNFCSVVCITQCKRPFLHQSLFYFQNSDEIRIKSNYLSVSAPLLVRTSIKLNGLGGELKKGALFFLNFSDRGSEQVFSAVLVLTNTTLPFSKVCIHQPFNSIGISGEFTFVV